MGLENIDVLLSILIFVVVSTITPGPNNLLLAASGVNYGFRATVPHLLGIHLGVYLLVALCALGLGQVLLAEPRLVFALKIFGSLYLLYLTWVIVGSAALSADGGIVRGGPMSTLQAFVFQFSNPKAWFMAVAGVNIAFGLQDSMSIAAIVLCLGFATAGLLCNLLWVGLGASLQRWFANPTIQRRINLALGALMLATVGMIWLA